jgi:hypothetical protein
MRRSFRARRRRRARRSEFRSSLSQFRSSYSPFRHSSHRGDVRDHRLTGDLSAARSAWAMVLGQGKYRPRSAWTANLCKSNGRSTGTAARRAEPYRRKSARRQGWKFRWERTPIVVRHESAQISAPVPQRRRREPFEAAMHAIKAMASGSNRLRLFTQR